MIHFEFSELMFSLFVLVAILALLRAIVFFWERRSMILICGIYKRMKKRKYLMYKYRGK